MAYWVSYARYLSNWPIRTPQFNQVLLQLTNQNTSIQPVTSPTDQSEHLNSTTFLNTRQCMSHEKGWSLILRGDIISVIQDNKAMCQGHPTSHIFSQSDHTKCLAGILIWHLLSTIRIYMCTKCTFVLLPLSPIVDIMAKIRRISISSQQIQNRYF